MWRNRIFFSPQLCYFSGVFEWMKYMFCVGVCVCMHYCVCVLMCVCVCVWERVCVCVCVCTLMCVCVWVHLCQGNKQCNSYIWNPALYLQVHTRSDQCSWLHKLPRRQILPLLQHDTGGSRLRCWLLLLWRLTSQHTCQPDLRRRVSHRYARMAGENGWP